MSAKEIHYTIDLNIKSVPDSDTTKKLDLILKQIGIVLKKEGELMSLSDDVLAAAQRGTTVTDSVLALVQKLVANAGLPPEEAAKIQAALDELKSDQDRTEAAILANTPQAPVA